MSRADLTGVGGQVAHGQQQEQLIESLRAQLVGQQQQQPPPPQQQQQPGPGHSVGTAVRGSRRTRETSQEQWLDSWVRGFTPAQL